MNESKIELTNRLKREGRWGTASLFKDETIRELRDSMKRSEANKAAWTAMEKRFPPVEIPEEAEPADNFTPDQIADLPPGSLAEFAADADWVYGNLEGGKDTLAPSLGAVGLLRYARENKKEFYQTLLPKALQLQDKGPDSEEQAKQEDLKHAKGLRERIGKLVK